MKVVYKKSIIDKLSDAIVEAWLHEKEIEKFVLTKAEASELKRSCHFDTNSWGHFNTYSWDGVFYGVPIEVEGEQ